MPKKIHEILLEIRKNNKLSRKKFSNLSGFKERTVLSYEREENRPSDKYIRFISLYFNVSEEYIRGLESEEKEYSPLKRTFLMYQDIYNYSDKEMINLLNFKSSEKFYKEFLEIDVLDVKNRNAPLLIESVEYLNIKPSCIGLMTPSLLSSEEELKDFISNELIEKVGKDATNEMYRQNKEWHEKRMDMLDKRIVIMEKKGINLNAEYYAKNIKQRNLAKDNYTPPKEVEEIPQKYKNILDLLPYASDKFLNDIHEKLKTMKNIQSL